MTAGFSETEMAPARSDAVRIFEGRKSNGTVPSCTSPAVNIFFNCNSREDVSNAVKA